MATTPFTDRRVTGEAGDGKPFVAFTGTPAKRSEPTPEDFTPIAYLALNPSDCDTPEKRQSLARTIFDSKALGTNATITEVQKFCECLWKHSRGIPLVSELTEFFEAQKKLIEDFNRVSDMREEAMRRQERLEVLKIKRERQEGKLSGHRYMFTCMKQMVSADLAAMYLQNANSCESAAIEFGKQIAGARELHAILKKQIIPNAEKEIKATIAAIGEFELTAAA